MRKTLLLFPAVLVLLASTLQAQPHIDCTSDDLRIRFLRGQSLTVPCDSMYLISDATLLRFHVERDKLLREAELADREIGQLRSIIATQDTLLGVHRDDIRTLEEHFTFTQTKLDTLQTHLEESIELTGEVIGIARRKQILSYVAGGLGGAAVGLLVGRFIE